MNFSVRKTVLVILIKGTNPGYIQQSALLFYMLDEKHNVVYNDFHTLNFLNGEINPKSQH